MPVSKSQAQAVMEGLAGIARCPCCDFMTRWFTTNAYGPLQFSRDGDDLVAACGTPVRLCPVLYFRPEGQWIRANSDVLHDEDADNRWRPATDDYF